MKRKLWFIWFLLGSFVAVAQPTKEELQKQKVLLEDQIDLANSLLKETQSSKKASMGELQTLTQKIRTRERLIQNMSRQIAAIEVEMAEKSAEIDALENRVDSLMTDYARLIQLAARQQEPTDQILFILSSKSFAQAAKRLQYFKDMTSYRKRQVEEIKRTQEKLAAERVVLEEKKAEKEAVQQMQAQEKSALEEDAKLQKETVDELKTKESQLRRDIRAKQSKADQLEQQIKQIIAEELRKAKLRAERTALEKEAVEAGLSKGTDFTDKTTNAALKALIKKTRADKGMEVKDDGPSFAMTPEARALANSFAANKGSLPWPVERGIVTGKFGKHPHPVVKGVIVDNPHIEISTQSGAVVRCAFEGEVSSVVPIPGANIMVLVRHGNYFTVYSNLREVKVKSGTHISIKDPIGTAFTDEEGKTIVQFGIWKDAEIQDPEPWLAK